MKQKIAVNDANILIDFCDIGLMDALVRLDLALWTSDLVISEIQTPEQRSQVLQFIATGHFLVAAFSATDIGKIALRQTKVAALSLADCSVLFLAEQQKALLLTGDRLLRMEAEKAGIEVHGSLWILDRMVQMKAIDTSAACRALLELMVKNPRLPKGECAERIEKWCEGKS